MAEKITHKSVLSVILQKEANKSEISPSTVFASPQGSAENVKSELPYGVGESKYIEHHGPSIEKSSTKLHDILEIPLKMSKESDSPTYAKKIIEILDKSRKEKWNFDTNIKFMNLILYIPKFCDNSDDISIPNTAVSILGDTFYELIYGTKAWIFTSGDSNPVCNTIGEGLLRKTTEQKNLTNSKKRLELTGLIRENANDSDKVITGKTRSQYLLENDYCKKLELSPFSNLHILLKDCSEDFIEKLLYHIGKHLKIPTLKLSPEISSNKFTGFKLGFLDPFTEDSNRTFHGLQDLHKAILCKADDFFQRNQEQYAGWNIMIMAILLKDDERVNRALTNSNLGLLEDIQILRIIRYALFYGSDSIVKKVFEVDYRSMRGEDFYKDIIAHVFNKSMNEVFLYKRLMTSLNLNNKVEKIGIDKEKDKLVKEDLERAITAIQKLASHDFLFEVNQGENVANKRFVFFAEYIMLWGVMSQKYEVAELFLSYSGTDSQHDSTNDHFSRTEKGVYQICNALAISWLLKKMAEKLKKDDSITRKNLEQLYEQSKHFDEIATKLLDYATMKEDYILRTLLNTPSPFWGNKTALDLAKISNAYNFLNHHAIQIYLSQVWRGHDALRQKEGDSIHVPDCIKKSLNHPFELSSFRVFQYLLMAPRIRFYLHGAFFVFIISCFFLLLTVPKFDRGNERFFIFNVEALEWLLFICLLGFSFGEIAQYFHIFLDNYTAKSRNEWKKVTKISFYNYIGSLWNKIDIVIIIMFITSVMLRLLSLYSENFPIFIPRLAYGFTAIPVFIRSIQFILVLNAVGTLIYTMYQGFCKMIKFLLVILLLSFAVGILQVALLRPSTSTAVRFRHFFFTPFFQIFGEHSFNDLISDTYGLNEFNTTNGTVDEPGIFWVRSTWILYLVIAIWILIINVLVLNLMIAYFTQIYTDVTENSKSIYIWQFIEIVDEYENSSLIPPPFNLVLYPYYILKFLSVKYCVHKKDEDVQTENRLMEIAKAEKWITKKEMVYFAQHYDKSFADKFWESKNK